MGKLLALRQDIEMEKDEDGVFRATRRVWVTTPDGRLCDDCGPTIILDQLDAEQDPDLPYGWRTWYNCMRTLRTDFDEAEDGVESLVAMDSDTVEALAEAARRIVDKESGHET